MSGGPASSSFVMGGGGENHEFEHLGGVFDIVASIRNEREANG
jgi:hypothetical protein